MQDLGGFHIPAAIFPGKGGPISTDRKLNVPRTGVDTLIEIFFACRQSMPVIQLLTWTLRRIKCLVSFNFFYNGATAPSGRGPPHYRGFTSTLRHTTLSVTPLDEWSARRRDLYLTKKQDSQQTDIHALGGIRTRNPSKRAAASPSFRPRGHWDRLSFKIPHQNRNITPSYFLRVPINF